MAIIGIPQSAQVTSWVGAGTFTQMLLSYNLFKDFTFTAEGGTFDASGLTNQYFQTQGKLLKSAKFSGTAYLLAPQDGRLGSVTYGSGYTVNLNSWELTIKRQIAECTQFGDTWKRFTPGQVSCSGTYKGFQDATTGPYAPLQTAEPAAATFTVIAGGTGKQLAASIVTTSLSIPVKLGSVVTCDYGFNTSGAITTVGSSTSALWAADGTGALLYTKEEAQTLTLQTVSGQTLVGTAIWSDIQITNTTGQPVMVKVDGVFTSSITGLT